MSGQVEAEVREQSGQQDDGLFHYCCCHSDDLGLCGTDLTFVPYSSGDGEPLCVVCQEVDAADDCEDECVCPCCIPIPVEAQR